MIILKSHTYHEGYQLVFHTTVSLVLGAYTRLKKFSYLVAHLGTGRGLRPAKPGPGCLEGQNSSLVRSANLFMTVVLPCSVKQVSISCALAWNISNRRAFSASS
jgi:hypothetical protein